jgi:peroxiredoxin (alkyl hydroperoxide reductase subunit C)
MILLFYPTNFTFISSIKLTTLNDRISEFRRLLTQILAISINNSLSHLYYLLSKQNQVGLAELNYPVVLDLN